MEPRKLLEAFAVAERLKDATRHCYTSGGRHESVAEHSWMTTLMAFFMRDEFPEADMDKVIRMCMIHDLGEAFTGDIPTFEKTAAHEQTEEAATARAATRQHTFKRLRFMLILEGKVLLEEFMSIWYVVSLTSIMPGDKHNFHRCPKLKEIIQHSRTIMATIPVRS